MLSWIFRNRRRLRVIYGTVPAPELAGPRFRGSDAHGIPEAAPEPARPRPGELRRRKHHLLLRPMPRRIA